MILVFIFLAILILTSFAMLLLALSNIQIELKQLHISNTKGKLKLKVILNLSILLFNRFKLIKLSIDNKKIIKILKSGKVNFTNVNISKESKKIIKNFLKSDAVIIETLSIDGYFSTFNNVLSGIIFSISNALIPILISKKLEGRYNNNISFLNQNQNIINISINCIISIKIVNIINTLYLLKKKGGSDKYGKSSNRRSYAYSNE